MPPVQYVPTSSPRAPSRAVPTCNEPDGFPEHRRREAEMAQRHLGASEFPISERISASDRTSRFACATSGGSPCDADVGAALPLARSSNRWRVPRQREAPHPSMSRTRQACVALPLPGSEVRMNVPAIEADAAVPVVMTLGWKDVDLDLRVRGGDLAYASEMCCSFSLKCSKGRNAWHGYLIAPRPRYRCRPLALNEFVPRSQGL